MVEESLHWYLVPQANLCSDIGFLIRQLTSRACSRSPNPLVEGKGKRPRRISPVRFDSNDVAIPPGGPFVMALIIQPKPSAPKKMAMITDLPRSVSWVQGVVAETTHVFEVVSFGDVEVAGFATLAEEVTAHLWLLMRGMARRLLTRFLQSFSRRLRQAMLTTSARWMTYSTGYLLG